MKEVEAREPVHKKFKPTTSFLEFEETLRQEAQKQGTLWLCAREEGECARESTSEKRGRACKQEKRGRECVSEGREQVREKRVREER